MSKTLIVIGPGRLPDDWPEWARNSMQGAYRFGEELDLLAFRDDPDDSIAAFIRSVWGEQVRELSGAHYLASVDTTVKASISEFVEGLRQRLIDLAPSCAGEQRAERFGQLWWKATISEKNSPADDMWWQLFRVAAVKKRLEEEPYQKCILIGDNWFVSLGEQVVARFGIRCDALSVRTNTFSTIRVILTRLAGGLFYFLAALMAKRHERSRVTPLSRAKQTPPRYLIHTFFPRMWTDRFGGWKDMYYGSLPQLLKDETGPDPVYALRAYDSNAFVSPAVYKSRLGMLNLPEKAPECYVLLESFVSLGKIIRTYLSPWDVVNYYKLTRHPEFGPAFVWEGIDIGEMLKDRLWRSVFVYWPNLEVLEDSVRRMSEQLRPQVVVSYCFEFIFGQSIISGTRQGAPDARIVGLQHGPISPMKLLYSGVESERTRSVGGGAPLPEPDIYSVDGAIAAGILRSRGISQENIRTPGAARFDDVWNEVKRLRQRRARHDRLRVLVAPGLHDTPFVLGLTLKALSDDPRLELILKPHPKVPVEYVTRLLASYTCKKQGQAAAVSLVKTGSIYEWMVESDIFLATYSSVGVEAIAFGLPVILLLPSSTPDMSLFHSHSVPVMKAATAEKLREHVNNIASEPEMVAKYTSQLEKILYDSFGPTDSRASHRLAKVCTELECLEKHRETQEAEAVVPAK